MNSDAVSVVSDRANLVLPDWPSEPQGAAEMQIWLGRFDEGHEALHVRVEFPLRIEVI